MLKTEYNVEIDEECAKLSVSKQVYTCSIVRDELIWIPYKEIPISSLIKITYSDGNFVIWGKYGGVYTKLYSINICANKAEDILDKISNKYKNEFSIQSTDSSTLIHRYCYNNELVYDDIISMKNINTTELNNIIKVIHILSTDLDESETLKFVSSFSNKNVRLHIDAFFVTKDDIKDIRAFLNICSKSNHIVEYHGNIENSLVKKMIDKYNGLYTLFP